MDFITYQETFSTILNDPTPSAPYDDPHYLNYAKLNWSRQQRWLKSGVLNQNLTAVIKQIHKKQLWTIITEPWCGDAAHILPFIHMLSAMNLMIEIDYRLRDTKPFLIDKYLTNGTKAIPQFIIADEDNNDLAVWGPRPTECKRLYDQMLHDHLDAEQKKIELQKWYNADKGESFQLELLAILEEINKAETTNNIKTP